MAAPQTPRTGFATTRVPIHPAMAERIVRIQGRSNRVALTHMGETVSFESPDAFRAEIRRIDQEEARAERAAAWDALPLRARLHFIIAGAPLEIGLIALSAVSLAAAALKIGLAQ